MKTVSVKLIRDQDGFEKWLRAIGVTYDSLALCSDFISLRNVNFGRLRKLGSAKPDDEIKIRGYAHPSVSAWLKSMPASPDSFDTHRAWVRYIRGEARKRGITDRVFSGLIAARATQHVRDAEVPLELGRLYHRSKSALASLERINRGNDAPEDTASTIGELRLAHEHLVSRVWEVADLDQDELTAVVGASSFDTLAKIVTTLEARVADVLEDYVQSKADSASSTLSLGAAADEAVLSMISRPADPIAIRSVSA